MGCCWSRWGETTSRNLPPPTGLLFIAQMKYKYGEPWWNDNDREIPKNWEKNLSQCPFVHHKSHIIDPVVNLEPQRITAWAKARSKKGLVLTICRYESELNQFTNFSMHPTSNLIQISYLFPNMKHWDRRTDRRDYCTRMCDPSLHLAQSDDIL
jgi:Na+-transporting NADH:ubiquinone oxidoreductase subunit NqrF